MSGLCGLQVAGTPPSAMASLTARAIKNKAKPVVAAFARAFRAGSTSARNGAGKSCSLLPAESTAARLPETAGLRAVGWRSAGAFGNSAGELLWGSSNKLSKPVGRRTGVTQAAVAAPPAAKRKDAASPDTVRKYGFTELERSFIEEYNANAVLYKHDKTGAEVMSVCTDDENKVFGIVFRTPPKNSTGIPHILEHSVLCGSRKYPCKEPFVELLKGSLHTFLNAFTYPDRTCYPVASTNLQDFYNLIDVYLDAVFYPKCVSDEMTFQQEGWHYELEDPKEPVTFKGVVFNEMKGVYSQPDNILARYTQQALFPDNTYGVDSGGDPAVIPDLTFEEFKDFHGKFYHPSNARVWFYGDDDPDERLRILSSYLEEFEANPASQESAVQTQKLFSSPKRIVKKYPVSDSTTAGKKDMVTVNWVLAESELDLETELALGFLDHLLLGTPAAPLRKTLLESGLGEAVVGGGMDDELRQPTFSIGLKGVAADDVSKVEELVMETLKRLKEEGFTKEAVEASVNTIEFSLRENNTGSFPRGLSLMLRSMGKWLYGRDPFEPLRFAAPLDHFKNRLETEGIKGVFAPLIEKYLLDNSHRVIVELKPDSEVGSEDEDREKARLASVKASLSEEDLKKLMAATEALRQKQETPDSPEALACVPALALSDIPKTSAAIPLAVSSSGGSTILRHDLFTNDVLYAEIAFDLHSVPERLLSLVPLFSQALLEMGTADLSFVELNQLIGRKTGGISAYPMTSAKRGEQEPVSYFMMKGKAMAGQTEDLFDLMRKVLVEVKFDDQSRFRQFVGQAKQRMESRLLGGGQGIAASRLDAKDNTAGWVGEQMGGLSYLEFLRQLESRVDSDWNSVRSSLEEIRQCLLGRQGTIVNLTADEGTLTRAESALGGFLDALPALGGDKSHWSTLLPLANEALIVPTQVNYVGKAANLYKAGYELKGSAYVISKFIGNTWLWDRVRVSGGAYGGFCDFDSHSGVFTYLSYRDPNFLKTLDNYDGTVQFLRELQLDQDSLTKAIIGTIGDIDSYQLPDAKGYTSMVRYMLGISDEERQRRREEVLATTEKDFHEFAEVLDAVRTSGQVVAVASEADVEAAIKERPSLILAKHKVL